MLGPQKEEVLLFDLGGVLVDFAGFEELHLLLREKPTSAAIREKWIRSAAIREFESGEITAASFARRFVVEWHLSLSPEEILRRFSGWSRGLYPGAARLLHHLSGTHRIACLSNSNEVHGPSQRRWLDGVVEKFFFSFEMGLAKPDSAIFDLTIRSLGVPASRIAYFDDTPINVEAAAEAGMTAFHVRGLQELTHTLREFGVLPD